MSVTRIEKHLAEMIASKLDKICKENFPFVLNYENKKYEVKFWGQRKNRTMIFAIHELNDKFPKNYGSIIIKIHNT